LTEGYAKQVGFLTFPLPSRNHVIACKWVYKIKNKAKIKNIKDVSSCYGFYTGLWSRLQ